MHVVAYLTRSTGDWGGASRYLMVSLKALDRTRYAPLVLLPKSGPILEELDRMGVRYRIWGQELEPHGLRVGYMKRVLSTMALFRQERVALVHINHASYWRPAEVLGAKLARIPVVTHLHTTLDEPGPFVRLSDLVIANSRFTAEHSNTGSVPKAIVHNAVDLDRYDAAADIRAELGLEPDALVVAFIGQIRRIKGVDLFIELAARIADPGVRFLIVGECRDRTRFRDAYTEGELERDIAHDPRIRYAGYRLDIQNLYRTADIVVVPSRWDEPFGLINIEAGAARRPVVASRVGGIPEVIRHGENGFLFERGDAETLAAHVARLLRDPALRRAMGERGRRIVEAEFADSRQRELEALYEGLIRGHRPPLVAEETSRGPYRRGA